MFTSISPACASRSAEKNMVGTIRFKGCKFNKESR